MISEELSAVRTKIAGELGRRPECFVTHPSELAILQKMTREELDQFAHENGWRTVYCHLRSDPRRLGIVEGVQVPAMGVVGEVGSTGHSTGPHLHFSLLDHQGRAQDPLLALYTPAETLRVLKRMGLAR